MITKIKKIAVITLLTALLLLLGGCEDTTTTTEIFPDGSCKRTVVVKSESENIFTQPFPIPGDSSWTTEEQWRLMGKKSFSGKDKEYVYTAEKFFSGVSDLNDEWKALQNKDGSYGVGVDIQWEKRHAWFFTYYTYREVYRDFFPFRKLPMTDYFTPEEAKIIMLHFTDEAKAKETVPEDRLKELEKKFDEWSERSAFEEWFEIFLEGAKALNSPDLKPELIVAGKEELFAPFSEIDLFGSDGFEKVLKQFEEILQTPDVWKVRERNSRAFSYYESKLKALENLLGDEFTNRVVMPGLITDTNAPTVEGRRVSWKFGLGHFLLADYDMWVTSRRVNWWAVGIAGAILLLIFAALIAGTVAKAVSHRK